MTIREKILIVEDEKSIAHFISTILTTNGYETILAKTGTEAMTMLSSHCPDLVILDLGLPDMDGIEVLRSLRGWSSLPVVVVSARTSCSRACAPPSVIRAQRRRPARSRSAVHTAWAKWSSIITSIRCSCEGRMSV